MSMSDLFNALPTAKQQTVSLLDALPDPNAVAAAAAGISTRSSLLDANPRAISAAERFAVMVHKKQAKDSDMPARVTKKRRVETVPKKTREKRLRGKEMRERTRGNQRGIQWKKKAKD